MAQSKIVVNGLKDKGDADKLVAQTEHVAGIRWVNVNVEEGYVVITHSDAFDEVLFKAAVEAAGFSV
ncbi:hypothetical protein [Conchiformibius steedae]|uniref:Heavy-metal-associated domain-containing protein n=1 Tax=Conchiformibius steedae TaxID=153493 RepID=A0A3P2A4V9_9NEIS|nr:hypothetical protein [Conchiformibius steedae]RRD89926.1 hypothetical protein EII21_06805 [Conchiformibius steedae]